MSGPDFIAPSSSTKSRVEEHTSTEAGWRRGAHLRMSRARPRGLDARAGERTCANARSLGHAVFGISTRSVEERWGRPVGESGHVDADVVDLGRDMDEVVEVDPGAERSSEKPHEKRIKSRCNHTSRQDAVPGSISSSFSLLF